MKVIKIYLKLYKELFQELNKRYGLFRVCVVGSFFFHFSLYLIYVYLTLPSKVDSENLEPNEVEIDFEDIPPELIGGTSSPAPVEKQDWVEGTNKNANDPDESDIDINKVSGDGTDKDGYLFSYNGDKPPTPIIDFDLKDHFPPAAKAANIVEKTVTVLVQIDEKGQLQGAKIVSGRVGYGFEEAALRIVKLARWSPGYVKGVPTKMSHRIPINFYLEE